MSQVREPVSCRGLPEPVGYSVVVAVKGTLSAYLLWHTGRPIDLLRDMPQFVIIEPKHSAKQNYVPVSNLR